MQDIVVEKSNKYVTKREREREREEADKTCKWIWR